MPIINPISAGLPSRRDAPFWIGQLQTGGRDSHRAFPSCCRLKSWSVSNDVFVQRLYQGLLGRAASASEVSFLTGQLAHGTDLQQIANSLFIPARRQNWPWTASMEGLFPTRVS